MVSGACTILMKSKDELLLKSRLNSDLEGFDYDGMDLLLRSLSRPAAVLLLLVMILSLWKEHKCC